MKNRNQVNTVTTIQYTPLESPIRAISLTVNQAATTLGISKRMVYQLIQTGRLPAVRLGVETAE